MSRIIKGIAAGGGITIAPVFVFGAASLSAVQKKTNDVNHEVQRLHDSFSLTRRELLVLAKQTGEKFGRPLQTIETQLTVLNDHGFQDQVGQFIKDGSWTADWAVQAKLTSLNKLSTVAVSSPFWNNAVNDLRQRILSHLLGRPLPDFSKMDHRAIIVAHRLSPTQVIELDQRLVAGIVTDTGGSTSHFSLLSEELSVPVVVGAKGTADAVHDDMVMIVDGIHGCVVLSPSPAEIEQYHQLQEDYEKRRQAALYLHDKQTISKDGIHYQVDANLSLLSELSTVRKSGAEGIGAFRTEFMFMGRPDLPSEEEQFQSYREVVQKMDGRPVTIRTLDIGNDKTISSIHLPAELNPALGMRGIRVSLNHPHIFRTQLRAILRASAFGPVRIMFPLIATINEFQQARGMVDEEKQALQDQGVEVDPNIEVGMMVETPSAVTMADELACYADFFSIGSNDLTQYLFAADRNNEKVAYLYQAMHPAMLRTVHQVIRSAHAEGKWVEICGRMGALTRAQPLLMAMGLDTFSVPADHILPLRQLIHGLSRRKLQPLLHQALSLQTAAEVEDLVRQEVSQLYQN